MTLYDLPHNPRAGTAAPRSGRLRIARDQQTVDLEAAEQAVTDLLIAIGHDPASQQLVETPRRVAKSYAELLTPRDFDLATFPNDEGYDELVLARGIPFQSLCQHHLLPFSIGSEVAASARQMGPEVAMVDPGAVPLAHVMGPEVGAVFRQLHASHGVDLYLGTGVEAVVGRDAAEGVRTADGRVIELAPGT